MKSDFLIAVTQLAAERNLPKETVMAAIEAALISAYKKDAMMEGRNISVRLNPATGEVKAYVLKTVVEVPSDLQNEISQIDARKIEKEVELGATIPIEFTTPNAGRIAAQTAKQVVLQRLREAERESVYEEYASKEGDVISAVIQRMEPRQITVDLGRAEAILPATEQVPQEHYRVGQRMKVYILQVSRTSRGPEIITSRAHKNLLKRLFELEVPEIYNGFVEIKAAAREAGARSKIAVWARQEGIDPVGSCVGLRGIRIQNIVNELQGEKIDVVLWDKDMAAFIGNALSPSQVLRVEQNDKEGSALVVVPDRQLSLAIGKEGQNARLAAKLTGWRVDIKSSSEAEALRIQRIAEAQEAGRGQTAAVSPETPPQKEELKEAVEALATEIAADSRVAEVSVSEVTSRGEPIPSLEEELTALSTEEKGEPVPEGQALSLDEVPEEVWAIPKTVAEPSTLRFAEDIMGPRAPKRRKSDRAPARVPSRGNQRDEQARVKKSGGRRERTPVVNEEDTDDDA
ncbi:MAG: transcription termination/antitermination protein NusA [Chloroflexi bacterium]|nr:transcription termination/antitermination protein NusA [Chloroflexota bacterium]